MKSIIALLGLFVSINAFAADEALQQKPANEYCFVWVGDKDGNFVDRKEIRFPLDIRNAATTRFELEFEVDSEVRAEIYGGITGYRLSLFKAGNKARPLASGFYNRTGVLLDFNTTGFEVYTDTAEYGFACVTESYIK